MSDKKKKYLINLVGFWLIFYFLLGFKFSHLLETNIITFYFTFNGINSLDDSKFLDQSFVNGIRVILWFFIILVVPVTSWIFIDQVGKESSHEG